MQGHRTPCSSEDSELSIGAYDPSKVSVSWESKTPEEIIAGVQHLRDQASGVSTLQPYQEVYSESTFKHLLDIGYFPGIKLAPEFQAEEINARLAPKWPRLLREIRNTIRFNTLLSLGELK